MSNIKIAFRHVSLEQKATFADSTCLLTISVGQETHEGELFALTIDLVNKSFKSCIILVDDSLQRYTMALSSESSPNHLYKQAILEGEQWLRRNKKYYTQLTIPYKILHWDQWLKHDSFKEHKKTIKQLLKTDETYLNAFKDTANGFLRKYCNRIAADTLNMNRANKLIMDYLIEECTALCLWVDLDCQFELYPGTRNNAMSATHKNFVIPEYPNLLHPVALRFRHAEQLKPQKFGAYTSETNKIKKLEEQVEMLEGIIAMMPGHVYWVDTNGVYRGCNDAQAKSAGLTSRKNIVGLKNKDLPWNKDAMELVNELDKINWQVMMSGKPVLLEEPAQLPDGKEAMFLSNKTPLYNSNREVIGMVGVSIDITARKEAEHLRVELNFIDTLLRLSPGHVYWKDLEGKFLGCNDLQAKDAGFRSSADIVGMTDYDMPWKEDAELLRKNDTTVINNGRSVIVEEPSKRIDGKRAIWLSHKEPLKNSNGEIIGIIGMSIDITEEKEKELALAKAQEEFRKVVGQMVHDIRTPLSTLQMTMQSTREIPEEKRIALRDATIAITDITGQLLRQYEPEDKADGAIKERQIVIASTILASVAGDGRSRHKNKSIKFIYDITPLNAFLFIKAEPIDLKRSLSNLINNAAEAMPKSGGTIELKLTATDEWVTIKILDDGSGIPKDVLEKINKREIVTHGKKEGHGLGMSFVRDMIEANHGEFAIASATDGPGHGTTITLRFPRLATPDWEVEEISLTKDDTVIILDDDTSIHKGWDSRLAHVLEKVTSIKVKHFSYATDVIEFVDKLSEDDKDKVCLLSDYELIGQELNGLQVIEKVKIRRSILVTSHYANVEVRKTALNHRVKVLPKDLVHVVPINVIQARVKGELSHVHIVFVDDEKLFTKTLISNHYSHLLTESYSNPLLFLDEVEKYPKDTRIILDNYYYMEDGGPYNIDGVTLAEKLHAKGFTKLILLSGEEFNTPDFLRLVLKTDKVTLAKLDRI